MRKVMTTAEMLDAAQKEAAKKLASAQFPQEEEWEELEEEQDEINPGSFVMTAPVGYNSLAQVFQAAIDQASIGKGKERHANDYEPFESQKICDLTRRVGLGGPAFQVCKKTMEAQRVRGEGGKTDLLGAMNYLAAMYLVMEEEG